MNPRSALPDYLPESFSIAQARSAGVRYGRTRGKDLTSPFHGVRTIVSPKDDLKPEESIRRRAAQYAPRLRPGQFFCESTALALHHLPLPRDEARAPLHIGVRPPATPPRTRGVVGHQFRVRAMTGDPPRCSAIDAWVQCARRLRLDALVVIGDALVRREEPLATLSQLQAAVLGAAGSRGSTRLVEALGLVRSGTDSPKETEVRLLIVRAGLPEPAVNETVRDARGRKLGLGDLVYSLWRVVIEYDGGYHFANDEQIKKDIDRLARFTEAGWTVIRVHKHHLLEPDVLVRRIRGALLARGWGE